MAKIKLNGDTSGYIEISAPAVSGNNTLELGPGTRILTNLDNTFTGVSTFTSGLHVTGGNVKIGTTTEGQSEADDLTIATSGHTGMTIRSGETSKGAVYFSDGTSGNSEFAGYVEYNHQSNYLRFGTASAEKIRITSGGNITYGNQSTSTANNSSALVHISAGKEYWSGTAGDYRALKLRIYDNTNDDVYGMGVSAGLFEIQSQSDIGFFAGGAGSGTGRRHERMRIEGNTGNVSIGSASSGGWRLKVQVADSSSYQSVFNLTNNVNADFQIELKSNETRFGPSTNTPLAIKNGAGEKLRITSAGDIGIGINAPTTGNISSSAKFIHIHNSATTTHSPAEIYFTNANSGSSGGAGGLVTFYNTGFYFWNYANDDIVFGTGGNERFKFNHAENALDFVSTSKIRLKGSYTNGQTHAHLNIGSDGSGAETRAIDIWGSWGDQESKSITWNHGSGTSNMVCQQRVRYNTTPSSSVYEIGRLYHNGDTTAYPFQLQSTSTTAADLTIEGNVLHKSAAFVARSTSSQNITSTTRQKIDYTVDYSYQSVFNNSNDRFTAQKAGLYFFYARHWFGSNSTGTIYLDWLKNGSLIKEFRVTHPTVSGEYETIQGSGMIYMAVNDYLEVYGRSDGNSIFHESNGAAYSEFSGFYVSGH